MLGDTKRPCRDSIGFIARAITSRGIRLLAQVGADDADRIVHRERQRNRAPFTILVQHQLRFGRPAAGQGREQHESPVVLVTGKQLPTTFLFVVVTPNPIAAGMLGGEEPGRFV